MMKLHPISMVRDLGRRGVAALEFVVIVPLLALIMISISDLAISANRSIRLEAAARAAAQFAFTAEWANDALWNNATPNQPVSTTQQTVARQAITWLAGTPTATTVDGVIVTITRSCFCGTNPNTPTDPKTCGNGGNENSCLDTDGLTILPTQRYVDIQVTQSFSPLSLQILSPARGRAVIRVR